MRRAAVLVIILITLATAGYRVASVIYANGVLKPMRGASLAGINLQVGKTFNYGVQFVNNTQDRTLMVRPATLPHGVPRHVRLVHEMIVRGGGFIVAVGWPPKGRPGYRYSTQLPDGYQLKPHQGATVSLSFVADRPGAYLVGPVTIHVVVPGPFGIGPFFPAAHTYEQYGLLCVEVSAQACRAARMASPVNHR